MDDWAHATGEVAAMADVLGVRSAVASPIVVEGRLWGTMIDATNQSVPLPADTESRIVEFTELLATAISNAESREALTRLADEQAALRRVATLVAEGVPPADIFSAVSREVERLFRLEPDTTDVAAVIRFDPGPEFVLVGTSIDVEEVPLGSRWEPKELYSSTRVLRTGRSARVDESELVSGAGDDAEFLRRQGYLWQVGSPILVDGRLWGVITMNSKEPLPAETEERLERFTDLVATAISQAESREALAQLVAEQAALRRVATLVALEGSRGDVFTTIADAISGLLGEELRMVRYEGDEAVVVAASDGPHNHVFPLGSRIPLGGNNALSRVFRTGEPVRIDDYREASGTIAEAVRPYDLRSVVATPIVVEGRRWGATLVATFGEAPVPPDTESRLGQFTELMATAIANAESREALALLADEQAALRRVATLAARGVPAAELFSAVTREVARVFGLDQAPSNTATAVRFDPGPECVLVGASRDFELEIGSRWRPKQLYVSTRVLRTGRSARVDAVELESLDGPDAEALRVQQILYQVGSPVVVEGRPWGAVTLNSKHALPPDTDRRLERFTELVATAISNAESRQALAHVAEEQAALRRMATLVAQGVPPREMFSAVTAEVSRAVGVPAVSVVRYETDGTATELSSFSAEGPLFPVGRRWSLEGTNVLRLVRDTSAAARIDDYSGLEGEVAQTVRRSGLRSTVGIPLVVAGRVWGAMVVSGMERLPHSTESRLADFTELLATAIANAESRGNLERLVVQQAALRRVATLVAQGVRPVQIFSAVSNEVGRLFGSDRASVARFEPDGAAIVIVGVSEPFQSTLPIGTRFELDQHMASAVVSRTGKSARVDVSDIEAVEGAFAETMRGLDIVSTVASPIVVEGRLWGTVTVSSRDEPLPDDAEERLEQFTELVATAIANAEGKSELAASRRRIVTASDETRRRIERDLHDGAQQRLVSIGLELRGLGLATPDEHEQLPERIGRVANEVDGVIDDLREMSRGIHPAILSEGGLAPALRTLARRAALPVELELGTEARLPEPIEVAAYYVVSEALTNTAKHAQASRARVTVARQDGVIHLSIDDDGVGGADAARGSGLVGLRDRIDALGGSFAVDSPRGEGTVINVELPVADGDVPPVA